MACPFTFSFSPWNQSNFAEIRTQKMYRKSQGGMLTVTKLHPQVSDNKVTSPGIGQSDILPLWGFCGRHKGRSTALSLSSACMFLGYTPPAHHKHTHTHTCVRTNTQARTHARTHAHTHRYTYTHACTHTHIHRDRQKLNDFEGNTFNKATMYRST